MLLMTQLEEIVDREGLQSVVRELAAICAEKAEHVSTNHDDLRLVKCWTQAGVAIDDAADKLECLGRLP